jgi:hypothetical protein
MDSSGPESLLYSTNRFRCQGRREDYQHPAEYGKYSLIQQSLIQGEANERNGKMLPRTI